MKNVNEVKSKDYYNEIDTELKRYEEYRPYKTKTMDWICNRIDWAYKWGKITKDQMEELAGRVCDYLGNAV